MAAANPIRIVPLHGDALAAPVTTPQLTYRGGPLLPAAQVFIFFWGTAWEGGQAAFVQQLNQFFDFVLTSALLDQLGEYSVTGMTAHLELSLLCVSAARGHDLPRRRCVLLQLLWLPQRRQRKHLLCGHALP